MVGTTAIDLEFLLRETIFNEIYSHDCVQFPT